jgi:hypothetical protein
MHHDSTPEYTAFAARRLAEARTEQLDRLARLLVGPLCASAVGRHWTELSVEGRITARHRMMVTTKRRYPIGSVKEEDNHITWDSAQMQRETP